jgi:hypothetical protein
MLTARAIKVTIPLDAAEVLALTVPDGQSRLVLTIACGAMRLTADVAAKAARKAQATIRASGAENVFVWCKASSMAPKLPRPASSRRSRPPSRQMPIRPGARNEEIKGK